MKISVIILAAGKGTRMKTSVHKQYINIFGKPILYYTLKRFSDNDMIDEIILVTSKDEVDFCKKNIIEKYNISKVCNIVEGGKERHESVFNGLKKAKGSEIVLIHDGVRPFVSDRIIEEGIELANKYGAAACGVKPKDTIKIIGKDRISKSTLNRDELFCVQTPQVFNYNLIYNCHENIKKFNLKITDDTMVVENCGHKVFLYEGNYENIKITTPEDLIIAKEIIKKYTY